MTRASGRSGDSAAAVWAKYLLLWWMLLFLLVMYLLSEQSRAQAPATFVDGFPPANSRHWDGHEYPIGHRNYGLRVPFYLYSGGGFDAFTGTD